MDTPLIRHPENPVLKPVPGSLWESYATFNGSIIKENGIYYLFYRAMSDEVMYYGKKIRLSTIGKAVSSDGIHFAKRSQFIHPDLTWELYGCEDPRVTKIDNTFFIFYTALSGFPPNYHTIKSAVAISHDLETISAKHLVTPFNAKGMTMFPEKINGLYSVLLTVDTDKPPAKLALAQFEKIETLWDLEFWHKWYENITDHTILLRRVTTDQIEIGAPPLKTSHGWLLIYSYIKHYFYPDKVFRIEAALFDLDNPKQMVGRIEKPCLVPEAAYERAGQIENIVFPEGAIIDEDELKVYYGGADSTCCLATSPLNSFMSRFQLNSPDVITCHRFPNNPLLEPISEHPWESKAVFNPAAILIDDITHIIYRTQSENDISYLGLAISHDGICIDERIPEPIYVPRSKWEIADSKNTPHGCEDPRITRIGDVLYMCYTAHNGKIARLAMTSISVSDFVKRDWSKWKEPIIISPPDVMDKDGCLFPEKVNGKYAFFHRIEPNIVIDFVDDLEFKEKKYLDNNIKIHPRPMTWDDVKIGINAPPIKTSEGWIVFYHGISQIDHHYRLGALLLDLVNLSQVKARITYPILEPEEYFERVGVVNNVVFPCGFVEKNGEILLYYGGADKVTCGARIDKSKLLTHLIKSMKKQYITL